MLMIVDSIKYKMEFGLGYWTQYLNNNITCQVMIPVCLNCSLVLKKIFLGISIHAL